MKRERLSILITGAILLLAAFIFVISMSYEGGHSFDWFAGFKLNSSKARDSIALGTWSFIIVGIGLSISGFAMQSLTRNQLASSYSLGTISGATLSLVLVQYVIAPKSYVVSVILSFIIMFAISAATLALTLSNKIDNYKIIIVGITISVLISSLSYILKFVQGVNSEVIGFLSLTTLSYTWPLFWTAFPIITLSCLFLIFKSRDLQIYSALPEKHINLGVRKNNIKIAISIPTILISISSVLLIGPISFVGIIIPHITRMFFGKKSLLVKMLMNIPISIIIILSANMIYSATFSYGTNINVLLGIITAPLIIWWILRSKHA